ncbi:hypothetical protein GGH94_003268 [Coemansia aciculifera]|uniref:Transcription regulator Rua1 C-terminal domain-containing protein n=1 Tax=Coemansia aciculifera TaxID=417176 RepID=A0A9W8M3A1_9FUNG|nr:hypothetical protein GGH94_003268 [Coemansia aciculifera]
MLPLTPNYYTALVEYYRLAALADCQTSLPPPTLPQLIQELNLADPVLAMSSGALSFATNPATMMDQDMSDLAIAAAAATATVNQSEPSLSPTSVGASTPPAPPALIPHALASEDATKGDDHSKAQLSLDDDTNAEGDNRKAVEHEHTSATVTADPLQQSTSVTPEQQSLSAPATDAVNAEADVPANAGLASSLLLKPFTGVPSQVAAASSQGLSNGANSCISPLDMLIAALDPQKSQHLMSADTPQPAVSLDQATAIANNGCSSAGLPGADQFGALWNSVPGAAPAGYGGISWSNTPSMHTTVGVVGTSRRASDAALLSSYQLGRAQNGGGDNSPAFVRFDRTVRKGSYPPGIKRPFSDFDHLLSAADMYAAASTDQATSSVFSHAASTHIPAKHARHDSMIECAGGGYGDPAAFLPTEAAAAAAAAVAAANISYSNGAAFDPMNPTGGNGNVLSLDAGIMSMMPNGSPMSQPHVPQGMHMDVNPGTGYHPHGHHHSRSLSFSRADHHPSQMLPSSLHAMGGSPMVCAATNSADGYYYDGLAMDGQTNGSRSAVNGGSFMASSNPIPLIPGVTVSPKEQPRRLSVPDLSPPPADESNASDKTRPRRQKVRFSDDMYTPMWVRNNGQQKEGFCDTCVPGKWLQLKNSAFWYHKQFFHGISSVSGRPFIRPLQVRHFDADIIEGLCHQCRQWVPIANAKRRNSVLWFRHAHKCHVYHKPKHDCDTDNDGSDAGSASAMAAVAYMSSPHSQMADVVGVSMTPHLTDGSI